MSILVSRDAWVAIVHFDDSGTGQQTDPGELLGASLHGIPMLARTTQALEAVVGRCLVCLPERLTESARRLVGPGVEVTAVSSDRGSAVLDVLRRMPDAVSRVLVHDAERPLVCPDVLVQVRGAVESGVPAALPALDVPDTIKQIDVAGRVVATVDRAGLRRAQTPQGFDRTVLASVLERARRSGHLVPDVAAAVAAAGIPIQFVPGDERLLRIRSSVDLAIAEALMSTGVARAH